MRGEKVPDEPFDGEDVNSLDMPAVEQLIIERNSKINQSGAYMTGLYWDLGLLLLRLKQICGKHGQWEGKLNRMGIGANCATKAMKIRETFDARADCEQMPVAKAYAMRKRKKTIAYESPQPPDNSCFRPNEHILLANARFQDMETLGYVKPETADLLLGDPPYVGDWISQIPDLAAFAARVLKPDGLAVFYYGNTHLNVMIREMEKHLRDVATLCHPYEADGLRTVNFLGFEVCWKPIIVFSKDGWKDSRKIEDMLPAFGREKDRDYWQQSLALVERLLKMFSEEGDLVIDPVAGTYTTMEACVNRNRRFIGCDTDPAMLSHGKERWEALKRRMYDDLHDDASGGEETTDG